MIADNTPHHVLNVLATYRMLPSQQFIEHHAERKNIRSRTEGFMRDVFGRHIGRCSHQITRFRALVVDAPRHSKVHHPRNAVGAEQDIRRLDVAMNDALAVRITNGIQNLHGQRDAAHWRDRSLFFQHLGQSWAIDKLEHQIRLPVLLASIEQGDDIRVLQTTNRTRLGQEALHTRGRCGRCGKLQGFNSNFPIQMRVMC